MIVTSLEKITGTLRDVAWGSGRSRRFLLQQDNMGFSLTDTTVDAGTRVTLQYDKHLEACYLLSGNGDLTNEETGEQHKLEAGVLFALDKHDRHSVYAHSALRMVCVFSPALVGDEKHSSNELDSPSSY